MWYPSRRGLMSKVVNTLLNVRAACTATFRLCEEPCGIRVADCGDTRPPDIDPMASTHTKTLVPDVRPFSLCLPFSHEHPRGLVTLRNTRHSSSVTPSIVQSRHPTLLTCTPPCGFEGRLTRRSQHTKDLEAEPPIVSVFSCTETRYDDREDIGRYQ